MVVMVVGAVPCGYRYPAAPRRAGQGMDALHEFIDRRLGALLVFAAVNDDKLVVPQAQYIHHAAVAGRAVDHIRIVEAELHQRRVAERVFTAAREFADGAGAPLRDYPCRALGIDIISIDEPAASLILAVKPGGIPAVIDGGEALRLEPSAVGEKFILRGVPRYLHICVLGRCGVGVVRKRAAAIEYFIYG